MEKTLIAPAPISLVSDNSYEYLLAVSSDVLCILSPDRKTIIETIVDGTDNNGYIVQAEDENTFLDAIIRIKKDILQGINPLNWIL